jgi:glycosyltransferase involved in cell wall biosynthesis
VLRTRDGLCRARRRPKAAVVYGVPAGSGGLGQHAASIMRALGDDYKVHALGPGRAAVSPLPGEVPPAEWCEAPAGVAPWRARYSWLRWYAGQLQLQNDRCIGRWAAEQIRYLKPDLCYVFTQVGLETLQWAQEDGVTTVLESPNGHIRNFRKIYETETEKWNSGKYRRHPSMAMVERVQHEYELAKRVRVSSQWSKASFIENGVPAEKIVVFQQPVNLLRFRPPCGFPPAKGPLRVCFVGSLDLRKGFVYLLRAIKLLGPERVSLEIVGATGDRLCKQLLARESTAINLRCAPGDPVSAYQAAELMVLPTLEDGSPFAVAEAMACGLPVIVTDCCGSAEWVRPGETGWIVKGANVEALAATLEEAIQQRGHLRSMGVAARRDTERRAGLHCLKPLREWLSAEVVL